MEKRFLQRYESGVSQENDGAVYINMALMISFIMLISGYLSSFTHYTVAGISVSEIMTLSEYSLSSLFLIMSAALSSSDK